MANPKLIAGLVLAVAWAGWNLFTHQNQEYSTEEYWQNATMEDVFNVPQEALEPGNNNGPVLMWAAASTNDPLIIRALVKRGALINEGDHATKTTKRAFSKSYKTVKDNAIQATALSAAASQSTSPAVIAELIKLGANIDSRHTKNKTPLMIAATGNTDARITLELLKHGADISLKSADGETALDIAKSRNNSSVVKVLEKQFADLGIE